MSVIDDLKSVGLNVDDILYVQTIVDVRGTHKFNDVPLDQLDGQNSFLAIAYRALVRESEITQDVFAVIGEDNLKDGILELVIEPNKCYQYIHNPFVIQE
jgi:hypothetical protein